MKSPLSTIPIATDDGIFTAHYSADGLARLDFPSPRKIPETATTTASIRRWHKLTSRAVAAVLWGRQPGTLPPLDLSAGTPFQIKVWAELLRINKAQHVKWPLRVKS